jgi:Fe-S cluster assembly protein SufB
VRIQVETGSSITWKYPSCILKGDNSVGEFYSVALTNNAQQADTGTKMIHIGKNTRSKIISKGISAGQSRNAYRGLVQVLHIPFDSRIALLAAIVEPLEVRKMCDGLMKHL